VRRLRKRGLDPRHEASEGTLAGKTVVITGSLESMTRQEAKEAVEQAGGRPTGSVSSNTDYLVVGDDPGATKKKDAEKHGVETLTEKDLLARLEN
jgi:DNA ligase (NAD+)